MKRLSFIVPLYNSAKWLEKCLYSVLNQDMPESEMEIICVNDGSPDNSVEMAREIGKKHPCIIVLDQENQGPSGARNNGMRHATGKYLCFVDPDDFIEPNVYGRLVKQMEDEQLDMLRFNYQIVDEEYKPVEKQEFEKAFDYSPKLMSGAEFLATRLDIACNIWRYMYRREIITENELWCFTYGNYDDTPWLPQVLYKAKRINCVDTVVYDYLDRVNSLVRSTSQKRVRQQLDGAISLLKYMEEEQNKLKIGDLRLKIDERWKQGVIDWYRSIQAFCAISYLQNVARFRFNERRQYIQRLRDTHIFPLYFKWTIMPKICRKVRIANIHPYLLVWLLHIKNG